MPPDTDERILRYPVPYWQDPEMVLAALVKSGYTARQHDNQSGTFVLVVCPAGSDGSSERERVRQVIAEASVVSPENARFDPGSLDFDDEG